MPIVSKNTKFDELSYSPDNINNYAPRTSPTHTTSPNTPIPVQTPLESSVPLVTVSIPKIEDKISGVKVNVNVDGARTVAIASLERELRGLKTPTTQTGPFRLGGDIQNLIGLGNTSGQEVARLSDNFIRGGLVGVQQAVSRDYGRIDAFTKRNPRVFELKQKLLQKSNVLFEPSYRDRSADKSISEGDAGKLDTTNRSILEYNVQNTVDQTIGTAFGDNYIRHGRESSKRSNPDNIDQDTYYNNALKNSQIGLGTNDNNINEALKTNRLLALYNADRLGIQSNSKTLGGVKNIPISTTSPPVNSIVSNNNPLFFGGIFSRGDRGGLRIVTLNELRGQSEAILRNVEDRVRRAIGNTRLGGVVLDSLRALGVNVDKPVTGAGPVSRNYNRESLTYKPDIILYQYDGGPDSLYGDGPTVVRRYEFTGNPQKITQALDKAEEKAGKGILDDENQNVSLNTVSIVGVSGSLIERALGVGQNAISAYTSLEDKAAVDIAEIAKTIGQSPLGSTRTYASIIAAIQLPTAQTYNKLGIFNTNIDKETNQNKGSYSKKNEGKITYKNIYGDEVRLSKTNWFEASREYRVGSDRQDSINLTPLFISDTGFNATNVKINNEEYTINDLVKFRIEAIDGKNPKKSTNMVFRAYITDFSDNVSGEWNDVTYAGRGDKFYIYKGFNRKISVGFRIAALSEEEMRPIYQKLNYLMSNTLPDYTDEGLMRGPLIRMTVGNWVDSQPGILESVDCSINMSETPWEIAMNDDMLILPHIVDIKLSFIPIGAQTQNVNKIMSKNHTTSIIAQNYNGKKDPARNYIGDNISVATPYEPNPPATEDPNKNKNAVNNTTNTPAATTTLDPTINATDAELFADGGDDAFLQRQNARILANATAAANSSANNKNKSTTKTSSAKTKTSTKNTTTTSTQTKTTSILTPKPQNTNILFNPPSGVSQYGYFGKK